MKGKFLLFFYLISVSYVFGQNIKVSGTVTDASDQGPLIGVAVNVKGGTAATQTNVDGNFTIDVPANGTLVFSYIGYATKEVAVNNQTNINVTLSFGLQELEQVVVVGYGTQRKRDLTGSITSIKGEDVAKSPNVNPVSSLQGRVAGLTIVNSGNPGAAPTVRIRGINSTNSASPLYVVDGVFQSNIDYLNSADIESIEVLKDPSSIAVFGLQGGNGVIIVTTKRAEKGKTNVTYQGSTGFQKITKFIDVVDAEGFKKLYSAQLANINAAPFDFTNFTANTNWQDLITRTAAMNNHSLTISNTGEKTTTLLNIGYNNQQGVVKYGGYNRFVARFNQETKINNNIKVGGDITGNYFDLQSSGATLNRALWAAPITPAKLDDNTYYRRPSFQTQVGNAVAEMDAARNNSINKGYRFVGNLFGEVKFLKQFKLRSSFYADLGFNSGRGYTPLPYSYISIGENGAPDNITRDENANTSVRQNSNQYRKFQQDHTLSYDSVFNNKHKINAVVGFTTLYEDNTVLSGSRTDTTLNIPNDPSFWYVGVVEPNNPTSLSGGGGQTAQVGYLARVSYSYANKYLVNASIRRDGYSRISSANRYGTFAALGLGWVISEESFFDNKFVDFLKLRASWGGTGNGLGVDRNFFEPTLTIEGAGVFGENIYSSKRPAYLVDPNLKWETTEGLDFGIDARALNGRLSIEANYYDRTTKDIISRITLPNNSKRYVTNLGTISNKGVEVAIGWNDKIGNDFTYSISPNFSYNKNRVESLGDNFNFTLTGNDGVNRTVTGEPIGHFYGLRQIGIYQTTADLDKYPGYPNSLPGDIIYADTNNDGVISPADRENLGNPFPSWNYGINVSLGYKGFDFLVQGQGVADNYIFTERRTATFAVINYETNRLNAWSGPGSTNIEPILNNSRSNNYQFSTHYLEPGDYFRLRTVQLGYNINKDLLNKTFVKTLRLYVSGQNIKTWSKTTGYSPEVPIGILDGGADNGVYPLPAVYTFGINASF